MELKVTRYAIDTRGGCDGVGFRKHERRNSWTGRMHAEFESAKALRTGT